jgi:Protein of unknown function (DUF1573)
MARKILPILCALFIPALMFSQMVKPIISFDVSEYDFKNIYETNGAVSYEFEYTNTGKVPLILQNVHASCGCTTPEWTKEPVVPGQIGRIKVTFDPRNRPGPFTKTITVTSNAEPSVATLTIKGTVIPSKMEQLGKASSYKYSIGDLKLQTVHASFGDIIMGEDDTISIPVVNTSAEKTLHPRFQKVPDYLKVDFIPDSLAPNGTGRIFFTFSSGRRNEWDYVIDRLLLTVNGEILPNNVISLTANVKEDFSKLTAEQFASSAVAVFDTTAFDFGSVPGNSKVEHEFILTNKGKSDLYLRKVSASCGCTVVQPSKTVIPPGDSTLIKVTYNTQGHSGADKKAITVITNDPRKSKSILWIKALVESPQSTTL